MKKIPITINQLFTLLESQYQLMTESWWPFDTVYEMVIGAFLVQNTTWKNVEKSLNLIQKATDFSPKMIRSLSQTELITLIHSSGFHQNKSRNIIEFFNWIAEFDDDFNKIKQHFNKNLRTELLRKRGIGFETADAILLYAFNEATFIADSYARRLFTQLNAPIPIDYQNVKEFAETNGHLSLQQWAAFHGYIIRFAQYYLKPKQTWEHHFLVNYILVDNNTYNENDSSAIDTFI